MNPVERLLFDELTHLLDRIATSVPPGSLGDARSVSPALKARLDETDAQLATIRASMLEGYGRWRRALEDVENLWALAACRSAAAEEVGEPPSRIAA
jgi:hypothetical protein